jgi:hypothetical protein
MPLPGPAIARAFVLSPHYCLLPTALAYKDKHEHAIVREQSRSSHPHWHLPSAFFSDIQAACLLPFAYKDERERIITVRVRLRT